MQEKIIWMMVVCLLVATTLMVSCHGLPGCEFVKNTPPKTLEPSEVPQPQQEESQPEELEPAPDQKTPETPIDVTIVDVLAVFHVSRAL